MKIEFEGTARDVISEMVALLNGFGFTVEPVQDTPQPPAEPAAVAKKAKTPAKSKQQPQPEPQLEPEAAEAPQEEEEEGTVDAKARAAVDLLKIKNEQLDRLRDLFNAGKGTFVRELLAKYGDGAKVFPEVDAKHFPAIKADIDRELH